MNRILIVGTNKEFLFPF